jgi:DNA-binding XRE family transcriptional regulator
MTWWYNKSVAYDTTGGETVKSTGKYLKLKYLRERCGMTQADMGLRIGVSSGQYSKKENGTQPWELEECRIVKRIVNEFLASVGEPPMTIDEIFFKEKVSKTTQKKGA